MKKEKKKKMGRPTKFTPEKIKLLKNLCRMKPTLADCAAILEMDTTTIEKFINREYNTTFSEFRSQNMAHTRFMIIRNIIKECERGNTAMLIYASKNLCGWSDKHDVTNTNRNIEIVLHEQDTKL